MSTKPSPLFPVASDAGLARSVEENVKALSGVCHVCEVKAPYALVHASPIGVARIASELGLEVYHSKRGNEYYAVRIAKGANLGLVPPAPVSAPVVRAPVDDCPVPAPEVVPGPRGGECARDPAVFGPEPRARRTVDPVRETGTARLDIRGTEYVVRQTTPKRRIDVLRYEVRKDAGDVITEPYVVSFQDAEGHSGACSCPDWIYRRKQKGDCKHIHAVRAAFVKPRQATIPLPATA